MNVLCTGWGGGGGHLDNRRLVPFSDLGRNEVPCQKEHRQTRVTPCPPRDPEFASKVLQFIYGNSDAGGNTLPEKLPEIWKDS